MAENKQIDIKDISMDLNNYRMLPQKNEKDSVNAMISISSDRFFGVLASILEDEFLLNENIIVVKDGQKLIAKEGNRRIAALKLIHGILKIKDFPLLPESLQKAIKGLDDEWKERNRMIPCTIFEKTESHKADKIVSLTHGKGQKASRDPWTSVATARHNRDNGAKETGLSLLEKYIQNGKNLNTHQKERWSGDFPLTVLNESLRFIPARMEFATVDELTTKYPKIKGVENLEAVLLDIGLGNLQFKHIRNDKKDFLLDYGFTPIQPEQDEDGQDSSSQGEQSGQTGSTSGSGGSAGANNGQTNDNGSGNGRDSSGTKKNKANATNDSRQVKTQLRKLSPTGNRPKVVTLKNELLALKIADNPIAFCFLLRSILEISAKAYCEEKTIPTTNKGKEKTLQELINAAYNHLTSNGTNKGMVRALHGAQVEITNSNRVLSVTSLNQLVHNPTFSLTEKDICTMFSNVYPILEAIN